MSWKTTLFIFLWCLSSGLLAAQDSLSTASFSGLMEPADHHLHWDFAGDNQTEFQMVFSGLFLSYKYLVSSQDAMDCNFTPSCSEYGLLSIKKQGPIIGIMSTFDRLTRCHGFNHQKYSIDSSSGLLVDHP